MADLSVDVVDSDVIEIISAEEYDSQRAKLRASISWILTKAYGNNIPENIKDPFYENAMGHLQVKPQLINLMISSELYCQACSNMFSDTSSQWQGHWSIIQVLSRKGIYVAQAGDAIVTETMLMQNAPFRVSAHLALIDALMKAYASEIASVERVVQAVRRFTTFNASSELPTGLEETVLFWINKACTALSDHGETDIIQGETSQKVRIVSKTTPREPRCIPKMEDLIKDIGDGCSVAAVIAFYQPDALSIADVCLKENVGIADSLYNLRLIRAFCERYLVLKCFHFTYEDLLYSHENMHDNILVFLAELFFLLEAAEQGEGRKEIPSEGHMSGRRLPSPSIPQVSTVTKRSFQKTEDGRHHLEKNASVIPPARQPLLQKRVTGRSGIADTSLDFSQRQSRRSNSLSSPQERDVIKRSLIAWQDDQDLKDRSSQGSNLLGNVSMDWEDTPVETDVDPISSVELAQFETTGRRQVSRPNLMDPSHPEFMELTSVASCYSTSPSARSADKHEPLMPAKLRPAKEKISNHTKAEERGDHTPRKKMTSPTKIMKGKTSPTGSLPQVTTPPSCTDTISQHSSGSSMDETVVTPLASADLLTPRSSDGVTTDSDSSAQQLQSKTPTRTGYEAFTIPPASSTEIPSYAGQRPAFTKVVEPTATSYTLESTVYDSQSAREAGLPVIGHSLSEMAPDSDVVLQRYRTSREGSVASSRSSGDFSDHESHKIHQDHKARESLKHSSCDPHRLQQQVPQTSSHSSSPLPSSLVELASSPLKQSQIITDHLPKPGETPEMQKKPGTTSFAEIRRLKALGNVDNSGVVYMQHGQEAAGAGSEPHPSTLKTGSGQKSEGVKKATFARLPNETTWQQSALRSMAQASASSSISEASANGGEIERPPISELSQLRMKLEEKRREIERKKQRQEVQTAKIRQRLGKAAFMRVISKHNDEPGSDSVGQEQTSMGQLATGRPSVRQPTISPLATTDTTDGIPASTPRLTQALLQERLGQVVDSQGDAPRPTSLVTVMSGSASSSASTSATESPSDRPGRQFSREGIQQTIDGVRRRWFHGSDPEGELIHSRTLSDEEISTPLNDIFQGDMVRSSPPSIAAVMFGTTVKGPSGLLQDAGPSSIDTYQHSRESSQSPRQTPERRDSAARTEQEPYDESLNRLNRSLTELQGEIKRLTLQQAQFQSTQSPIESGPNDPNFSLPQQQQLQQEKTVRVHPTRLLSQPNDHPSLNHSASPAFMPTYEPSQSLPPFSGAVTSGQPQDSQTASFTEEDSTGNGFFVSFSEDSTPRRPKPKLGKDKDSAKRDQSDLPLLAADVGRSMTPVAITRIASDGDLGSSLSGSHHSLQSGSDESSSGVGFIINQDPPQADLTKDQEMQRKKERLMQQQLARKEQQERKRQEKETEMARKLEQKMLKEEEQERKKAEEKARREAIFQQYLQKKLEKEDEKSPLPTSAPVPRREQPKRAQTRPVSMFAKPRPVPADLNDSITHVGLSHSAHEDIPTEPSPPSSTVRAAAFLQYSEDTASYSPFRLNPKSRGNMRKAVSCNTLTQNGGQGAATYRRPPSPDLARLKRGSGPRSCDSSSETGSHSGSNASEYSGPKLYVKPSSKSNRHIIINAISHCCLAGSVNTDMKNKVLEEIARSTVKHFLILFRDHGCQYRGLYSYDPEGEEAFKIIGVGPRQVSNNMVERFYKYNSGAKSFTEVTSTKHLSVSIDAVVLLNVYWKTKATPPTRR